MRYIKFFLFIIICFTANVIFPESDKRIRETDAAVEINAYLASNFNAIYEVSDIVDIDSLRGDLRYFYAAIQNPYGLLTNSFVFVTQQASDYQGEIEENRVGVYRQGSVIWLSDPVLPSYSYSTIWAVDDINLDGTVEIIIYYGSSDIELWIVSWNGTSIGLLLNDEPIYVGEFAGDLVDIEGDGIMEIRDLRDESEYKYYIWNGEKYELSLSTPILPLTGLYPANNFIPLINVNIKKEDEKFIYEYIVTNDVQSKQRINLFWVVSDVPDTSSNKESPKYWIESGYKGNLEGWETEILNNGYLIWPGASLGGFVIKTSGLPAVVEFLMKAENELPDIDKMDDTEALATFLRNYSENIVKGRTIGPKEPHDTLDNITFLDSLISYDSTAYEFGWINNQTTFEKYDNLLVTAKAGLEKSDIGQTKSALEEVLREVDVDNSSTLSGEAYALLKYNTEYLIGQLPPVGISIESISPTMTVAKTKVKDFTLTVYGSNFTNKSDVYWNKKKKKTKFISENVLEANIKEKDIKKEGIYVVTVREKKAGQTDGVEFNVYKELPERLIPVLNCIEELDGKKSLAWFGYENYNDGIVLLDGKENEIKDAKKKKGEPPVIFLPGVHEKVFSVEYDDKKNLKWELLKEKAEVTDDTPPCE